MDTIHKNKIKSTKKQIQKNTTTRFSVPIYVISLTRSKKRRRFMHAQLEKMSVPYQFVDAIDGTTLEKHTLEQIERQRERTLYTKPFTKGEIGCMLSHMNVYKTILSQKPESSIDSNRQASLILEDDVFLSEKVKNFLSPQIIKSLPEEWDLVLLAYVQRGNIESHPKKKAVMSFWNRYRLDNTFTVGLPVQFCYHTAAYLVSRQGARKLQKHGHPLRMPADFLTGNSHVWGINLYTLSRPIIWQDPEFALQSTIKVTTQDSHTVFNSENSTLSLSCIYTYMVYLVKRIVSYVWNKIIMCAKGHAFPVVFLRQLGILPPDKI